MSNGKSTVIFMENLPKTLVCIGDSITQGNVSFNYVDLVAERCRKKGIPLNIINKGINSELTYHVLKRLDPIIALQPDLITILIGTNDINNSLTPANLKRALKLYRLPRPPGVEWFRENLQVIISHLQSNTKAKIALISPPTIGESLQDVHYSRMKETALIIKELAHDMNCVYYPLFETMADQIQSHHTVHGLSEETVASHVPYHHWQFQILKAIVWHYVFRKSWDWIACRNHFLFHTDHLHLNSAGAGFVADFIESFVHSNL
jgi:lysophospholipase L1-like esterase